MTEQKRCCENCGNLRCANSLVAFWWDECVDTDFEAHWMPKEEQLAKKEDTNGTNSSRSKPTV